MRFWRNDTGHILIANDLQQTGSVDLGNVLFDANRIQEHRSDDVFLHRPPVKVATASKLLALSSKKNVFGSSVSMDDIEIRKFLTKEFRPFTIDF